MKTNYLKLGVLGLMMMVGTAINAQQVTGDVVQNDPNGPNTKGSITPTVRVIDNKGTIKYLQSKNGITMLTNTTADVTTTTWQLGGTLTDATNIATGANEFKITLDTGGTFILDGILQEPGAASAADGSELDTAGYTLLVRDEATGQIKKLLASDLIKSGQQIFSAAAGTAAQTFTITAGAPLTDVYSKVWVYRNGAKLLGATDYTISGDDVTITPTTAAPADWEFYAGDVIEIQFVK